LVDQNQWFKDAVGINYFRRIAKKQWYTERDAAIQSDKKTGAWPGWTQRPDADITPSTGNGDDHS